MGGSLKIVTSSLFASPPSRYGANLGISFILAAWQLKFEQQAQCMLLSYSVCMLESHRQHKTLLSLPARLSVYFHHYRLMATTFNFIVTVNMLACAEDFWS